MPPKGKIKESNVKNVVRNPPQVTNEAGGGPTAMSPDALQQFEVELLWCIHQIGAALDSGKLSRKQIEDHNKALHILSGKAPIIKKRQAMRQSFGDYRAKMQAEEDRAKTKVGKMKVVPAKANKKSVCLKKSLFATSNGSTFRFNFNVPEECVSEDNNERSGLDVTANNSSHSSGKGFHFSVSENDFRFNFSRDGN